VLKGGDGADILTLELRRSRSEFRSKLKALKNAEKRDLALAASDSHAAEKHFNADVRDRQRRWR